MLSLSDPRSAGLVGSLPQTVFIEALHRLSPAHFVDPFRDLHHPLHAWSSLVNGVKRAEEVFDELVQNLFMITRNRTCQGYALGLAEYTHFLDWARAMGNGPLADDLWASMGRDRVIPDAICYNYYMEAKVWDHSYTGEEAYRLRIIPKHYKKRRMNDPNINWRGYRTGKHSIRRTVLEKFREMMQYGHIADERTYINVMLASARAGHGPGIRHVLQTVWNIDVDAIKETQDRSKLPVATPYEPWSGLYPTENLLFAVAHALGTNNDIPAAIKTVRFISSSYDIPITEKVWHELFERAYVLSRVRTPEAHYENANNIGKVSTDMVRSIFKTMTSEPYNVTPTVQMWRFMINISIDYGNLQDCKLYLQAAYNALLKTRERQQEARATVMDLLNPLLRKTNRQIKNNEIISPDDSLFQSPLLYEAINAYNITRLEVYQQTYVLKRILWVVVRIPNWQDTTDDSWFLRQRPKMIEEWRDFLPERMRLFYSNDCGEVNFTKGTTFKNRKWNKEDISPVRRDPNHETLFFCADARVRDEEFRWKDLLAFYPWLDKTVEPLKTLFDFQKPWSQEFQESYRNLQEAWVDYPDDHPMSTKNNPNGGFYGRLAALDMLKSTKRSVYLLDDKSWI
ncbi:hypothetical protein N7520_011172 [Penicillium odoratum]|uniref:uncharacterized protein n=1 Tax=Penicillium odoratum TaxID=1167516 RepID=UPI002549BA41|nr:uncharacterized protein N7520_011172 [Penicillium odoratum]KAJ5745990.1 hypothetical protein N7520_011172 [Penicillium odoratum]